jgi:hypothetical protein
VANLFKDRIIQEKLKDFKVPNLEQKVSQIQKWYDAYENGSLQEKTETQCEQSFNQDFFIDILGHAPFPEEMHTIIPKYRTDESGGQKPDAVLGHYSPETDNTIAVVEIKDANTSLDKPQRREGNLSPIQQGFKYKPQYKNCSFVIATNFFEIRIFKDNQLDFEQFTLESLVDPKDNYYNFRKFYYLLCPDNFITKKGDTPTGNLLSEIRIEQEEITKKFYKEYKKLRRELILDIAENNKKASKRKNFYELTVQKAQKIVDRLVLIHFFEDLGLLPDNKLKEVVEYSEKAGLEEPTWNVMKRFFRAIDAGSEKLSIPNGYNGELFKEDETLQDLKISDDICKKFVDLGRYDFSEDLTVNILGHIFEQSISDLERLREYSQAKEITKEDSKRKKEGIYYTPEYIVDYIVKNSLGAYMEKNEKRILEDYGLKDDILEKTYNLRALPAYKEYQEFLRNVKVLDPACGSGAFLVRIFVYLLEENKRVADVIAELEGGQSLFSSEGYIKSLLENNIYGVDLNQESVEITKLSLWLKTARRGEKLVNLHENIKCGNSLVDDPDVAGGKAFNWQEEFPDIFAGGGFDVIVGNPPYIKEYTDKSAFDGLHDSQYYQGKMDIWTLFGAKAIDWLKNGGYHSFIAPNNWVTNAGASIFRNKVLQDTVIQEFVDFGDYKVFADAGIQTMIYVLEKSEPEHSYLVDYVHVDEKNIDLDYLQASVLSGAKNDLITQFTARIEPKELVDGNIVFLREDISELISKIKSAQNFSLKKDEAGQGIVAPQENVLSSHLSDLGLDVEERDGIFVVTDQEKKALNLNQKENQVLKPFYTSDKLHQYWAQEDHDLWVIYTQSDIDEYIDEYPHLREHFDKYAPVITSSNRPYGLHRARDEKFFVGEKIFSYRKVREPRFTYTDFPAYVSQSYYVIKTDRVDSKFLTGLLNSKLIWFWLKFMGKHQGNQLQIDKAPLMELPFIAPSDEDQKIVSQKVENIIQLKCDLNTKLQKAATLLASESDIDKDSVKTEHFTEHDFELMLNDLDMDVSLEKKEDLLDFYEKYSDELKDLTDQIRNLENEIDQEIFDLYELENKSIELINQELKHE